MFDNIGRKIKILAQVICCLGIIASAIFGIVIMATEDDMPIFGFVFIIIGSLVSWASTLTIYGFGQLIENADQLVHSSKVPTPNSTATPEEPNALPQIDGSDTSQKED